MNTVRKSYQRRTGQPQAKACRHPEDNRIDARSMGHMDRFICGVCGERLGDWGEEA